MKEKVKGKGHLLASALFGGHRRNEPESTLGPLFGSHRKSNTRQIRRPENLKQENCK